jgi:NADPH:quinone reductase-like Zn-dependent oxidoreductase
MADMKAVRIHEYGSPDVLLYENAPRPVPGTGEVLVRVHATSINPIDWKIRAGYMKDWIPFTFPAILGWDLSGVVDSVGTGVTAFKKGDEVFAMPEINRNGAYAEYIVVKAELLAAKPAALDHAHAAAVPLAGLTAWHGLFEFAGLKAGQRVLIHGAAGGVGTYAVQLAKWKGAYVLGTSSGRNLELVKSLGADEAIDYTAGPFEQKAKDIDIVFDTIGGDTQDRSWKVLKKGGVLASTVGQPAADKAAAAGAVGKSIQNRPDAKILSEMAKLFDQGSLKVTVGMQLPLNEARRAHEASQGGHARGKIVLNTI